jgi:hypothetical protein
VPDASTRAREADRQIRDLQGLSSDLNLAQVTDLDGTLPTPICPTRSAHCSSDAIRRTASRYTRGASRISGGFDVKGPVSRPTSVPFGNVGEACIEPIGTGYTALTVTSQFHRFACRSAGGNAGATASTASCSITRRSATSTRFASLNLDGFGVKLNKFWDSTAKHISIERCGNASGVCLLGEWRWRHQQRELDRAAPGGAVVQAGDAVR